MHIHVVDHPLAAVALTRLRDETTTRPAFRAALRTLSRHLVYEASRTLATQEVDIVTPMGPTTGTRLGPDVELPLLVPVLRAGLGMLDAALAVLPEARTGFIGLKRNEETLQPDVRLHEPHLALVAGPDGLDVMRRLIDAAPNHLAPGGRLLVEIAPEQSAAVCELLASQREFTKSEVIKDLAEFCVCRWM